MFRVLGFIDAPQLVAKKPAFVGLGLFKILPQASDTKKEHKQTIFLKKSLLWTNNSQYSLSCLWACCVATKSNYRISLACKEATESPKYHLNIWVRFLRSIAVLPLIKFLQ